jgi:hypothetical protein
MILSRSAILQIVMEKYIESLLPIAVWNLLRMQQELFEEGGKRGKFPQYPNYWNHPRAWFGDAVEVLKCANHLQIIE